MEPMTLKFSRGPFKGLYYRVAVTPDEKTKIVEIEFYNGHREKLTAEMYTEMTKDLSPWEQNQYA